MSKYIKKVNWPWVEIRDVYEGDGTIVINMNEVSGVYDRTNTIYKWGVRWKDGGWLDNFSKEALAELKELIMNRKTIKTPVEMMNNGQTVQEWLKEEEQS